MNDNAGKYLKSIGRKSVHFLTNKELFKVNKQKMRNSIEK